MIKIFTTLTLIFFCNEIFASKSIVSGISTNEINIDTKFNGTKILLFGAKGDAGNVVIAVRGPKKNFLVTKKEKLMGVWYNGKRVKFKDSLSYYSIFSTFNQNQISQNLLTNLELGSKNIKFENDDKKNDKDFTLQLIEKLEKEQLYLSGANKIEFLDETLFKVMLNFPKNIVRGVYIVEIYLIKDDNLVSFQSIPIYVNQVGLSAKISDYAFDEPFLYAIFSVFSALIIGFLANYLFARFFGK